MEEGIEGRNKESQISKRDRGGRERLYDEEIHEQRRRGVETKEVI